MGLIHTVRRVYRDVQDEYSNGGVRSVIREIPPFLATISNSFEPLLSGERRLLGVNSVEDDYMELTMEKLRSSEYHLPNENSILVSELIEVYAPRESPRILEIGGNAGRHLSHLYDQGYRELHMIEMNPSAIDLFQQEHPEVFHTTTVYNGRAQGEIRKLKTNSFDVVYSNAVLQHINELDGLLEEIARICRGVVIFIEIESFEDDLESIPGLVFRNFHTLFEHDYIAPFFTANFEELLYIPGRSLEGNEIMRNFQGERPDDRYAVRVFRVG